jgi:hypothetical protein
MITMRPVAPSPTAQDAAAHAEISSPDYETIAE